MTFTSSPPRRREERQQSIAVLPPPSTITRLPILSMWPNDTVESQSMPMWMFVGRFLAARECRGRGRAARRSRRRPRRSLRRAAPSGCRCACRRGIRRRDRGCSRTPRRSPCRAGGTSESACASCRRRGVAVEHDAFVAERREIARDGERGGAGADQRDALAVAFALLDRLRQARVMSSL